MNYRRHTMAWDRRASVRSYDQDGHLRVADAVLTAAGVSEYYGSEVPNGAALGLEPNRLYKILRPAEELKNAAPTLAGKPLLMGHTPIDSENHPSNAVVGAVGSDVWFDGQFVRGSLTIWTAGAIASIETDEIRDLSAGYYYLARLQPGTFNGARYDAVMTGISFNHLALVPEGRVPLALVGDSKPRFRSTTNRMISMDNNNTDDVIDPNDDLGTQLLKFLNGKISPEDLSKVEEILTNSTETPPMVGDSRRRSPGMDARARASYDAMFPNTSKLKSGF
jgi:hypothetical protein